MAIRALTTSESTVYPSHFAIQDLIRPNILSLQPYRCARDDYQQGILLDANENALGHSIPPSIEPMAIPYLESNLHRYPDPAQIEIKSRFAALRGLPGPEYVFLGVGSDEVIDLLMRICCIPAKDKILTTPPTYGMYALCAQVNDILVVKVPQDTSKGSFRVRVDHIKTILAGDPLIKIIFLCSPGNPTGTLISQNSIRDLLEYADFKGIVVVDEAYIDFAGTDCSAVNLVTQYANVCIMQTMSKSFGLAGIRLGVALAQPQLIQILTNTKAPYNISSPTAYLALSALSTPALAQMRDKLAKLTSSRAQLILALANIADLGSPLGGNHSNFVILPVLGRNSRQPDNERSVRVYKLLAETRGVVVRYRGNELGCEGCLRITVGTEEENRTVVRKLKEVLAEI